MYKYICAHCLSEFYLPEPVMEENELCPICLEGKVHKVKGREEKRQETIEKLRALLDAPDTRDLTPYPEKNKGCRYCKDCHSCPDAFRNHAVHCGNYGIYEVNIG